jgi:molecular chaperone GrpE (heat shock protein)
VSAADPSETYRQAVRLAEDRIAEVEAAVKALKADNETFRDRLEGQLSEKFEKRRERVLLASVQTLEAMDRAIQGARDSDAAESIISGVMLVRTQLFRILQEEGLERVSVLGLPFDRRSAEVVQRRPVTDPDQDGLVIEELQGGHQLRGHIIRRAKVVVGEFADDAVEPAAVPPAAEPAPAPREPPRAAAAPAPAVAPPPIEPTVAMPALPEVPPAPPVKDAEEPIVVEDWTEPTQPGTPAALLGVAVATAPARPTAPAPPPAAASPATSEEEDDSASATMVLGDSAAMFVRPMAPVPATRGATAAAPAPDAVEETQENPEPLARPVARETQPVARPPRASATLTGTGGNPRPPARPGGLGPPRVRTGPVPPTRDRSPVYEDVPTNPSQPAAPPRPPTPTRPGVTAARTTGGRGVTIGLAVGTAVLLGVAVAWWALARRPKPPEASVPVAEASPLAASPGAVTLPPAIPEDVTVVAPSTEQTASPVLPAPGTEVAGSPGSTAAGTPVAGLPGPSPPSAAAPLVQPPSIAAAPATTRPTPPPAAPVNPVPALMSQAEQAMAAKRYSEAITKFNEVLKLDPQNAEAATGKLHAQGERASMGRYFLTAVTMSEGKASGGGIKGFDGGSVVKSQCECALTYEVSPANPAQGEPYAVSIFLRNDSKKDIKPQSISASVTVNGSSSNRPVSLATKEVKRGQKTLVGRLEDVWKVGTTSWSMEAAVGAGGSTYRAQLTWELRVPSAQ